MTTPTSTNLTFNVSKHGWKDAFVVSFLAIVLGAFVAQIASTPKSASHSQPVATTSATVAAQG